MLMRFDPFRELDRLTEQATAAAASSSVPRVFPMDAFRRGDQFVVHMDMPGVDPGSIELTVEKNVLSVKAERRFPREDVDEVLVAERPQGSFTRQLFLGDTLDTDAIQADYQAGVLTLTIPVAEAAKPRQIRINAAADQETIEPQSANAAVVR